MGDQSTRLDAQGRLVPLSAAEIADAAALAAAAPVAPVRTVEGRLLIKALTDDQAARVKLRDLLRISGDQAVPESNGAVTRAAGKIGIEVAAWFDAAQDGA